MPQFNPVSAWFRPKRIGWGWSPGSWEGWLVTLIVAVGIGVLVPAAKSLFT